MGKRFIYGFSGIFIIAFLAIFYCSTSSKQLADNSVDNNTPQLQQESPQIPDQNKYADAVKDLIDAKQIFNVNLDTSNWQTYRNEKMGFEIRIPKDWYVNDSSESGGVCFGKKGVNYYYEEAKEDPICLLIENNNGSPSEFRDALKRDRKSYKTRFTSATIDGYPAIIRDSFALITYIFREKDTVSLTYRVSDEYFETEAMYFPILQSIRFIR